MQAAAKFKKYVVLPASGFVFSDDEVGFGVRPGAAIGVEDIREILEQRVNSETLLSWQTPRLTGNEPQGGILKVLRSMEEDGPKLVSATPVAERLLRASGLRLVPLTTYRFAAHAEIRPFADPVAAAGAASRDVLRWLSGKISPGRRGDGVTVGVIDSGIDHGHPDLLDAVSGGRCTVLGEDDTAFGPSTGTMGHHGTHVAGIIAGRGRLNGVEGVAPGARLRSYRVFPKVGKELASNAAIMEAIQSAVDDECDIINLSLGGSSAKEDGMRDAINFAWESGVVCVAAAGNGGRRAVTYPARHANAIGVSAIGRTDCLEPDVLCRQYVQQPFGNPDDAIFLASFSNTGPQIDFAGPGVCVVSTVPGGGFAAMSGTSMAAPAVAGVAAVAVSRDRGIMRAPRDAKRARDIFGALVGAARGCGLGSFDYEGYGVPTP